jgi:hypothetical protein
MCNLVPTSPTQPKNPRPPASTHTASAMAITSDAAEMWCDCERLKCDAEGGFDGFGGAESGVGG